MWVVVFGDLLLSFSDTKWRGETCGVGARAESRKLQRDSTRSRDCNSLSLFFIE